MEPSIPIIIPRKGRTRQYDLVHKADILKQLKAGIWAYFILLIIEGALRKWFFPRLATPLLVVRDPLAMWLLFVAWKNNEMPSNWYIKSIVFIGIFAIFTALTLGHGNLIIALYGARILLFHFPLMFLIGRIFNRDDVVKLGRVIIWISLPMIVLVTLQFYIPQSAFINRGVGGDITGGGFAGALGFFRPPGTFSFTSGNTQFWGVVCVYIIFFWLNPKLINRWVLLASTAAMIVAVPLSISRSLFFQVGLSMLFLSVSISSNIKYLSRLFVATAVLFAIMLLLSRVEFFHQATEALTTRFQDASNSEGGLQGTLIDRFLGGLLGAIQSNTQPFFGYGIGMGTNVATQLLTGRVDEFLIAEEEWGRLVGEMGTLLGVSVIFIRVYFCLKLTQASFYRLLKSDFLPWTLLSLAFVTVAQAQWAQPTSLGFSTLIGGLLLASLKNKPVT